MAGALRNSGSGSYRKSGSRHNDYEGVPLHGGRAALPPGFYSVNGGQRASKRAGEVDPGGAMALGHNMFSVKGVQDLIQRGLQVSIAMRTEFDQLF